MKLTFWLLTICFCAFASWPEGQMRPLFKGSILRGSNSIQSSLDQNQYLLGQLAMGSISNEENVGYGVGLEWKRDISLLKGVYRSEIHRGRGQYLEYINGEISYSNQIWFLDTSNSLGLGLENESWCDSEICDTELTYNISGLWSFSPQVQVVVREQVGFRQSHSIGAHLGHEQATFELEYHYFQNEHRWVYRQLWELTSLKFGSFVLGSEFYSNPFLWSLFGELQVGMVVFRPGVTGVEHLGNRFELDFGVVF